MGMFDPNTPDLSTFNYQTQADQIKRQRDAAAQLLQTKAPTGQMVSGWYVKPSPLADIGSVLQTALGAYMMKKADDNQNSLNSNSLAAFTQQQAGLNAPVRDPNQDAVEAQAQNDREVARMQGQAAQNSGVQAGQSVGGTPDDGYPISGPPIPADPPSTAVPLPPISPPSPPLSAMPAAPVGSVSSAAKTAAAKALAARPVDMGTDDNTWDAPDSTTDAISAGLSANPDDPMHDLTFEKMGDLGKALVQGIKKAYGFGSNAPDSVLAQGSAAPTQATPAVPPLPAPQATPPMAAPQAMPPMPAPQGAPQTPPQPAPQMPPPSAAAPGNGQLSVNGPVGPNPFASNVPQANPGQDTLTNGMTFNTSDPNPYSHAPTQNDLVARLVALGRTSPEGQAIANAQLNQMFASKNGRFTTEVKPDPVNGGFVAVTTDSQTGQLTGLKTIGAVNGTMITGQRTDQNGNVVNVHKDGSITPMVDPSTGAPVKDSAVTRSNADAVSSLVTKRSDAQAKLADLTKMESDLQLASGLVGQANVGPLAGTVGGVYNKFLGNSTANDTLDRVLNDTRLQQILQDKGGNGTVGAGLMRAYQGHSMSRDLSPAALSQGLGQALATVQAQKQALQGEIGAHNFALTQLGYQDPTASAQSAPTTGRAPGNYSF